MSYPSLNGPKQQEQSFVDKQEEQLIVQDPYTDVTNIKRRAEKGLRAFIYYRNIAAHKAYTELKKKEFENAVQRRK
jgi:hypothetical protein